MNIQQALAQVIEQQDLTPEQMKAVMQQIMSGGATEAQIGGFLVAMRLKGETIDEIAAAAEVMRELATPVHCQNPDIIDIVGTGGDASHTFNVSTASTLVAAAAGASVAKHGNRSVSSRSGGADLLEAAGVNLQLKPEQVAACVDQLGVGFMLAQLHHSAMRYAIGPRREMAVRTIFNVLGPLTNPASTRRQVIGVFDPALVEPIAQVLLKMGSVHALVVHSDDGMDEISLCAPTQVAELRDGQVRCFSITPESMGLARAALCELQVQSPEASLAMIRQALTQPDSAPARMVALNAGAGLYVSGRAASLEEGVSQALDVIRRGTGLDKLSEFIALTQQFGETS